MKFRVGDLIKGKPNSPYSITSNKSICRVIKINKGYYEDLVVEVTKHETNKRSIGDKYSVESRHFLPVLTRNYIEV